MIWSFVSSFSFFDFLPFRNAVYVSAHMRMEQNSMHSLATIISMLHALWNGLRWMQHVLSASSTFSREMNKHEENTRRHSIQLGWCPPTHRSSSCTEETEAEGKKLLQIPVKNTSCVIQSIKLHLVYSFRPLELYWFFFLSWVVWGVWKVEQEFSGLLFMLKLFVCSYVIARLHL